MPYFQIHYFLLLMLYGCANHGQPTEKPNFIIIYTDDQRYDANGFSNNPVIKTPELDRFAASAICFTNANVVFSLCSPSRAALLTGRYGSANGVLELNSNLNENEVTIATLLKQQGYRTGMSGKWHIPVAPANVGFDFSNYFYSNGTYYGRKIIDMGDTIAPLEHCDSYCADRSIDFLRERAKSDQPFFLFHCTQTPHMDHKMSWPVKEETKAIYNVADMPVASNRLDSLDDKPMYLKTVRNRVQARVYGYPDCLAIQEHTRDYYAVITEMDDFLGRIFHEVEALGLLDKTYIFFMSDNGWMLGDHGFTSKVLPYRPSTHVPLWVRGPSIQQGTNSSLVLNIDIVPTILDLAGANIPTSIHGKSIDNLLRGDEKKVRDAFVYEGLGLYGGAKPNLSVISERYRYIETYESQDLDQVNFRELYDQENDDLEMDNLYDSQKDDELVKKFQSLIQNHKDNIVPK